MSKIICPWICSFLPGRPLVLLLKENAVRGNVRWAPPRETWKNTQEGFILQTSEEVAEYLLCLATDSAFHLSLSWCLLYGASAVIDFTAAVECKTILKYTLNSPEIIIFSVIFKFTYFLVLFLCFHRCRNPVPCPVTDRQPYLFHSWFHRKNFQDFHC